LEGRRKKSLPASLWQREETGEKDGRKVEARRDPPSPRLRRGKGDRMKSTGIVEWGKDGGKKSLPASPFDALRASRFRKGRRPAKSVVERLMREERRPVGTMEESQRRAVRS
jgi:hypothetical protein